MHSLHSAPTLTCSHAHSPLSACFVTHPGCWVPPLLPRSQSCCSASSLLLRLDALNTPLDAFAVFFKQLKRESFVLHVACLASCLVLCLQVGGWRDCRLKRRAGDAACCHSHARSCSQCTTCPHSQFKPDDYICHVFRRYNPSPSLSPCLCSSRTLTIIHLIMRD